MVQREGRNCGASCHIELTGPAKLCTRCRAAHQTASVWLTDHDLALYPVSQKAGHPTLAHNFIVTVCFFAPFLLYNAAAAFYGCWFVGGDDLTGALHGLWLQ